MKSFKNIKLLILLTVFFSCSKNEPEISTIPFIEFYKISYSKDISTLHYDTIKVSFYITDGDFDLGLDPIETVEPYNWKWYFLKTTNAKVSNPRVESGEYQISQLVSYKERSISIYDTLPKFESPYDCTNWEIKRNNNEIIDTVYFQYNENYYNVFIDFYDLDQDQNWVLFDWNVFKYPGCGGTFNARFPPPVKLNSSFPFKIEFISRKKILLTFSLSSQIWHYIVKDKVKFKIRIKDRALNTSNEMETPEVLLQ
jgi:hypothetical protein